MHKLKNKVSIPLHWTNEYLTELEFEPRPWNDYGKENLTEYFTYWKQGGIDSNNKKGLQWELYFGWNQSKELEWPTIEGYKTIGWWLSRVMPACVLGMHKDLPVEKNQLRLWVALGDYIPGHVFIEQGNLIKDYERGDAFILSQDNHGAANLTTIPKLSLQMIVEEKNVK